MELEGYTLPAMKGTIGRLMKEGLVTKPETERYAATSAVKAAGKTSEIMIEKIYPGSAVMVIDDKYRARLTPHDYNSPPKLIKKNRRFRTQRSCIA